MKAGNVKTKKNDYVTKAEFGDFMKEFRDFVYEFNLTQPQLQLQINSLQTEFSLFSTAFDVHMLSIGQSFQRNDERIDRIDTILSILTRQTSIILEENREFRQRADRFDTDNSLHERKIDNLTERVEVLEKAHI
jgi:hypothetical protein